VCKAAEQRIGLKTRRDKLVTLNEFGQHFIRPSEPPKHDKKQGDHLIVFFHDHGLAIGSLQGKNIFGHTVASDGSEKELRSARSVAKRVQQQLRPTLSIISSREK
jgi:hypothetical protein